MGYENGGFKAIEPTLDLLSYRAFSAHGRRRSAINEKFQHFLPVYLSKKHGERAMPLVMAQFKEMAGSSRITDTVLKILPCLMNSKVTFCSTTCFWRLLRPCLRFDRLLTSVLQNS